ncbi:MAG: DUF2652 domain-containing protein, partial [Acidimicrobiia bacterium]|nr:DUF2652 domain-containing protein [Acidimicrobiia bacterium]
MSSTKQGFLLIADITGYTRYLTSSELEHAQGILRSLMELLIEGARPPLVVSKLEGDAVFSYGLEGKALGGQTFIEMIEDTYAAFRRAIDLMVLNTTCDCNACANISSLDLKFFVHRGAFSLQDLDGRHELLGPDVITIHRLTKNSITETTGLRAYTLYTHAAIDALGLNGFTDRLVSHREEYEEVGPLDLWIQDMHPVWEQKAEELRIEISADDTLVEIAGDLPVPVAVAWEILTLPEYRAIFVHSEKQRTLNRKDGRIASGSVYECFHGNNRVTTQTILDWHPFQQITTEDTTPIAKTTVLIQFKLTPDGGGTRVLGRVG